MFRTVNGNPADLNPLFISSTYEFYLAGALFEGLFSFNKEFEWFPLDHIVEHFEESADHLVWTIRLQPGLTWQDGHPWTAEDVCFSWREILDERVPCPSVRSGTDEIVDCKVLDERTLTLHHKQALPTNKWNALFPIIPKHLYNKDKQANPDLKSGPYYEQLNRNPVGNGPWKFVRWVENNLIELERWEDYPGPKPNFKRKIFRIIPDPNIQLLSFTKGDIDEFRMSAKQFATQTGPDSDFAKLGYKVLNPEWSYSYIGWNQDGSNPFFNDVRVRRAMTHACNIPRMIRDLAYNLYQPSYGVFHPDAPMFNPNITRLDYDLDEAERLLDEAGWMIDEEREGWRYKQIDGKPVRFEFTLLLPQGAAISRDVAAIFQEDLKSIGVKMDTQIMEWATFQERTRKHEFHASMAAWGTGVDPDTMWNLWRSDQYDKEGRFGRNYGGFSNARVDELFELGRHEFDHAKRMSYYREMSKIIYDEQPYTWMWNRGTFWAVHKRLRGLATSPRGIFNFTPSEEAWWVPAGQAKAPVGEAAN
jgi:peptide/nickel transport system substrate-binding protein